MIDRGQGDSATASGLPPEYQGLTADMVRAWLRRAGWAPPKTRRSRAWTDPTGKAWVAVFEGSDLAHTVIALAYHYQRSVLAMLRSINPPDDEIPL